MAKRSRCPGSAVAVALATASALAAAAPASSPAMAQGEGGISVGEYHRVFPPAPVEVRAVRDGAAVLVTWSPPPAVEPAGQPAYDPAVAAYRIYRVDGAGGQALLGEVAASTTRFRDETPGPGRRAYAVTAVQRSGQESGPSAAAEAPPL